MEFVTKKGDSCTEIYFKGDVKSAPPIIKVFRKVVPSDWDHERSCRMIQSMEKMRKAIYNLKYGTSDGIDIDKLMGFIEHGDEMVTLRIPKKTVEAMSAVLDLGQFIKEEE